MAEIIQKGNTHKIAICGNCGCLFSYKPYEVQKNRKSFYVDCPDCFTVVIIPEEKNINKEA